MKIVIIVSLIFSVNGSNFYFMPWKAVSVPNIYKYGENITGALVDIFEGIPLHHLVFAFDNSIEIDMVHILTAEFITHQMSVTLFNVTLPDFQEEYFSHVTYMINNYLDLTTLFICNHKLSEYILLEYYYRNFIRRNILLIFYWGKQSVNRYFTRSLHEMLRTVVITNPKPTTYRVYYNQATSHKRHHLSLINWWLTAGGLFHRPTLPSQKPIFQNFNKKMFLIPVLHKPPWHFVQYNNMSITVEGGRDDVLLSLLASQLNFQYMYFDPFDKNLEMDIIGEGVEGVLNEIGKREFDFFLGDVTITLERLELVEFSFLTLADSIAFVTHAPSRLNEALALVRPFNWMVWPAIIATIIVSGGILYLIIALPNLWQPRQLIRSHSRLFCDCYWFTISLFLKQTGSQPSSSNNFRFFSIVLSLSATYIVADMYSANLTSLLARPGREKAVNNLVHLENAMLTRDYKLYIENANYNLLANGTGIYGRLWKIMSRKQRSFLVNSVEEGVQLVNNSTNVAMLGGRETLFFDIQRFGAGNFHLSEKLNTAYSAITFQIGCPYIENFNQIIISIFEAGILTKMTENEYEKLGKSKVLGNPEEKPAVVKPIKKQTRKVAKAAAESQKSQPITIKMLQGAFYLLSIGHVLATVTLFCELLFVQQNDKFRYLNKSSKNLFKSIKRGILNVISNIVFYIRRRIYNIMNEAIIETLEYID